MQMKTTPTGIDLIGQALIDETRGIKFTKVVFGNGDYAGDAPEALSNQVMESGITDPPTFEDSFATIHTVFTNTDVTDSFQLKEVGLLAWDPDLQQDVLFAYGYTDNPTWVSAATDYSMEIQETLLVYVGAVEDITAIITEITYATKAEFDAHLADYGNPHQVTAGQIGLGNVPNVTTNDQTPTYTEPQTLMTLTSGETLSIAFGKIAAAVKKLISHLADTNAHLSSTDRQKLNGQHNHSANQITSGTVTVSRGGSGQNSFNTNAILTGNGTGALKHVNTAAGAAYATAANAALQFGILPVRLGGTGGITPAAARENLNITPANIGAVPSDGLAAAVQTLLNNGGITVIRKIQRGKYTNGGETVSANITLSGFVNSNKMMCNLLGFTTTGTGDSSAAECYIELLAHDQIKIVGDTHNGNVEFDTISYEVIEFY